MKIVERNIDDLIFAEYNPRQLTTEQHKQLTDSLKRFGMVDPIIVNKHKDRENIIIGGHQRARIWKELGNTTIPTVEEKLPLDKEKELNVRLNKNTGEFDYDMLANHFEVEELIDFGFDNLPFDESILSDDDLTAENKGKDFKITTTFVSNDQLDYAIKVFKEIIEEKFDGAFMSVSGGEL